MSCGGHWNRAGRRSGGPRPAVIHVPPVPAVLFQLARMMIDEFRNCQDYRLTREHIRNFVRTLKMDRAALIGIFVDSLGSGENEIAREIAQIFADDVLREGAAQ
ncbi:MAG: hypothetical protein ACRD1X_14630 [Vicinamibacteria bacterium]